MHINMPSSFSADGMGRFPQNFLHIFGNSDRCGKCPGKLRDLYPVPSTATAAGRYRRHLTWLTQVPHTHHGWWRRILGRGVVAVGHPISTKGRRHIYMHRPGPADGVGRFPQNFLHIFGNSDRCGKFPGKLRALYPVPSTATAAGCYRRHLTWMTRVPHTHHGWWRRILGRG